MLDASQPLRAPSRRSQLLTGGRLVLAVAGLAWTAYETGAQHIEVLRSPTARYVFDPAPLFYATAAVGLALRVFWARWLAICFAVAIMTVNVFCVSHPGENLTIGLCFVALLSGRTMRALFEDRPGALNRWAASLDRRVGRLRVLFVAQSVAIAMIFAARELLGPLALPVSVAAGLCLAGLVFQATWSALAVAPVVGAQLFLAWRSIHATQSIPWNVVPPHWAFPAVLFAACAVSLAVVAPFLRAFWRKLREAGEPA